MRNSTTKAMLIHSAIDMIGSKNWVVDVGRTICDFLKEPYPHIDEKGSGTVYIQYGKGPDFMTGWGSVDAKGALDLIEGYDATTKMFDRFREFEIHNGMKKRWTFSIPVGVKIRKARVTLVWDDAVPSKENVSIEHFTDPKLVNDLDMYIVSPSGKIYYPWKLDPLPSESLEYDDDYNVESGDRGLLYRRTGLEKITLEDAEKPAYKTCSDISDFRSCFDHLNNVEVVDVESDNPGVLLESGEWQVVVEGYKVKVGNGIDGFAQVASIVSDFKLEEPTCSENEHPYLKNKTSSCVHVLGDYLENYVTFDNRTYVAPNDRIYLYDGFNRLIGNYTGSELAGKTVTVRTNTLKVVLESNDDDQQGWGYVIEKVEHLTYEVLFPIINDSWRKKK